MAPRFPKENPLFQGFEEPIRWEGELYDCLIEGEIPSSINGTFYRVMPTHAHVPKPGCEHDVRFNGDGAVDAIRIKDGHADFKHRYVRTQKFCIEREARKAIFGIYRNRYTDDPGVRALCHSTANTHIVFYNKMLLALKEDSPPYALDPNTLETLGLYTFGGQLKSRTFSAHPKFDPETGEMIVFGFEATGDGSTEVCYMVFDKDGKKTEECFIQVPHCGMMHDFAVTENYAVFHVVPLNCQLEDLKKGDAHFHWDDNLPLYIGLLPRRNPKPEDCKWFEYKNSHIVHVGNAYDAPDGVVYMDAPLTHVNAMAKPFPKKDDPMPYDPFAPVPHKYVRFELDPKSDKKYVEPKLLAEVNGEYPTVDPRVATHDYKHVFMACFDESQGDIQRRPFIYDSVSRANVKTGEFTLWRAGDNIQVQEPAFIPRSETCEDGDGYLIVFLSHLDTMLSSLAILDTADLAAGPVARILLPFRLKSGIHGSWVPASDLTSAPLCDMTGCDQEIKDFVKELENVKLQSGVEALDGTQKTADQDIPKDLPGIVNGPAGTAKWGIGKLHHGF